MGIYQRPDSRFWWLYLETAFAGQRRCRTDFPVGTTKTQKRDSRLAAEAEYQRRMLRLGQGQPAEAAPDPITFQTLATWYDTHVIPHHKGHERERQILPRLVAAFGSLELQDITAERVIAWRSQRLVTPVVIAHCGGPKGRKHTYPKPAPRTVNREVDFLQQILAEAVRTKQLALSPLVGLTNLPAPPIRRRTMTPDEEQRLLPALAVHDRAIVLVGLDGLVRLGDILDLRRADDHNTYLEIRDSKNGRAYHVPVSARLRIALDAVPVDPRHPDWYFPQRRRGKSQRNRTRAFRKALSRACAQAKPPVRYGKARDGITFHWATRRTGASRMIRAGGEKVLGVVQQIGNWKDVGVLVEIYQEAITDDMRAAVETVSAPPVRRVGKALRRVK
ncbi:MAG: tyrosine-type recombinase/integrase [Acidobacteriota bacterium]